MKNHLHFLFVIALTFISIASSSQGIHVDGDIIGFSDPAPITLAYENANGEAGTLTSYITSSGGFSFLIPLDEAIPGTFTICSDVCPLGTECEDASWASGQSYVDATLHTCASGDVLFYGTVLNGVSGQGVSCDELANSEGSGESWWTMYYYEEGTCALSYWVTPQIAGGSAIRWTDCNEIVQYDTVYWDAPDSTYNLGIKACPEPGDVTTVHFGGAFSGMVYNSYMHYSGMGFENVDVVLDDVTQSYSITLFRMPSQGSIDLCIIDCTGEEQCVTLAWNPGNTVFEHDFAYCPENNYAPCSAEFQILEENDPFNIYVLYEGSSAAAWYDWELSETWSPPGSGYQYWEPYPVMTDIWPNEYTLCLYVNCADGTWQEYCDDIVLNEDGSLEGAGMPMLNMFTIHVVSEFTGVSEVENGNGGLRVFPNPVSSDAMLMWSSALSSTGVLEIFNSIGQSVTSEKIISRPGINQWALTTANLESGCYVVCLKKEDGSVFTTRMVK